MCDCVGKTIVVQSAVIVLILVLMYLLFTLPNKLTERMTVNTSLDSDIDPNTIRISSNKLQQILNNLATGGGNTYIKLVSGDSTVQVILTKL